MSGEEAGPTDRVGPWRKERAGPGQARWVPVGTRGSGVLAQVDPAGLVGPPAGGWSLDWWVGAEDRWYVPARETAVRQSSIDDSPVVETRQRVPGGDVVHRVHGAQGGEDLGGREVVVVEVTNETPVPVALALAVRPYGVARGGAVHHLEPLTGCGVGIDGHWTVLTDRDARRAAVAVDGHDPLAAVTAGRATPGWEAVDDPQGEASLALVFPLPHTASLRVAILAGDPPTEGRRAVPGLPPAEAVASGWARQADQGLRVVLPDERLSGAFAAARRRLLLGGPDLVDAPVAAHRALVGRALLELGHHDELQPAIAGLLDRQRLTGAVPDDCGSEAATGAALALLGWWWRYDPRPELLDELIGPLAKGAHRIDRRRLGRGVRRMTDRKGLLPPGPQPVEVGGPTRAYLDDWWSAAGLRQAAVVLGAAGQAEAAADAARGAQALLDAVDASTGSRDHGRAIPVGPGREIDDGVVALLPAVGPLGVVDGADGRVRATLDRIRSTLVGEGRWVRAGVAGATASPWLTACLARHELDRGDEAALDRLDWLVRVGGPLTSWPARLHERGGGGEGRGDDPVATALFVSLVRALLCRERVSPGSLVAEGLDVLPVVPRPWLGAGVELHDAPTTFGRFGFAVRWHGERPALLWELEPAPGAPAPTITASGLAPGWSTTEPVGETLLPVPASLDAMTTND